LTLFGKISDLPGRWRALLAGASLLFLIILFFPFQSTIVPPWRLHVVDDTGAQVPDIKVTEHWQYYLLESEGHEDMLTSDERGRVGFPARTIRAGIASRVIDAIANFARQGAKAKFGPYASIVVWGSRDYETAVAVYQPGMPPQADIVVHRQR
jgi:hypothetical protein